MDELLRGNWRPVSAIPGLGEIQVLLQLFSQMTCKPPEAGMQGALLYAPREEEQYNCKLFAFLIWQKLSSLKNCHAVIEEQTRKA